METMKEAFRRSMVHMWPEGTPGMPREQFRDLVRLFSMGWMECLLSRDDRGAVGLLIADYEKMTARDWMPDASWDWTFLCDPSRN